jgi:hypothetical protein
MQARTATRTMIAAGNQTADVTGAYFQLDPQTEAVEIIINLTAIARTSTGTLQVKIEASYDDGTTFDAPHVMAGALATAAAKERFLYSFSAGLAAATATIADTNSFYQAGIGSAPAAGALRHHLKPHGYRAIADMAGDTTSFNVVVTLREVTEV